MRCDIFLLRRTFGKCRLDRVISVMDAREDFQEEQLCLSVAAAAAAFSFRESVVDIRDSFFFSVPVRSRRLSWAALKC